MDLLWLLVPDWLRPLGVRKRVQTRRLEEERRRRQVTFLRSWAEGGGPLTASEAIVAGLEHEDPSVRIKAAGIVTRLAGRDAHR